MQDKEQKFELIGEILPVANPSASLIKALEICKYFGTVEAVRSRETFMRRPLLSREVVSCWVTVEDMPSPPQKLREIEQSA